MRRTYLLILTLYAAAPTFAADWRDILSSGATTASTYMTFKDNKLMVPARDEASAFVASDGLVRGPYLEATLQRLRAEHPQMQASDIELASAILAAEPQAK
ncbi:DUF2388 domain-containing protein [Pseudomonas borbori]